MKSRRRIAFPKAWDHADYVPITAGICDQRSMVNLRCKNPEQPMSALGQKQTFGPRKSMSALPPKADINWTWWDVRFVPIADIGSPIRSPRRHGRVAVVEL